MYEPAWETTCVDDSMESLGDSLRDNRRELSLVFLHFCSESCVNSYNVVKKLLCSVCLLPFVEAYTKWKNIPEVDIPCTTALQRGRIIYFYPIRLPPITSRHLHSHLGRQ